MIKYLLKSTILLVTVLSALLVFGLVNHVSAASIVVNPPFGDVEEGKDLEVDVVVQGEDELVDGVDANIGYDVNFLKVKELKKGEFFSSYPILKDENGLVKITALAPKEGVKIFGDIVVATLIFEVQDSGDTNLTIAFEGGATSESNVAQHGTAKDLLTDVTNGSYSVVASPEKLQEARARRAKQSGILPIIIFIIFLIIAGLAFWYYRKKKKPDEDYFVPEAFPMDEVPKSDEPPKEQSPPTN